MKWRPAGNTNSLAVLAMSPRISIIAAIDSLGNAYMTLTQVNTNSEVMGVYFKYLAQKLD